MKITLRQLEVFAAIASHGQVTRAAQQIAMSQAAASMALADLENQLDSPLFIRQGRQWQLTDTAREILPLAHEIMDRIGDIENIGQAKGRSFDIRIGASVTIGNRLLPGLIARLSQDYPLAQLHISRHNTEQVVSKLLAFQIDLGFIEGTVNDPRLVCFQWEQDELLFFAAPDHPLAKRMLTPEDLKYAKWVTREPGSGTRARFEQALNSVGITPQISLELEQTEAVRQCVRLGLGLGCLSSLELNEAFLAGWLVPLKVPFLKIPRELRVAIHAQKHRSKGIQAVLDLCGIEK